MNTRLLSRDSGRRLVVLGLLLALAAAGSVPALAAQADDKAPATNGAPARAVDLNKASADELTTIPGVGAALAQRIIEFREKEGPFRRVEDLMKVKGIGEKSFQKMRQHVKVETKG